MDKTKSPLPPTQKPDPEPTKSSDLPRQPEQSSGEASRARQSIMMQQSVGNSRTGRVLEEAFHTAPEKEQHLADVYGADKVDQEKHAAHATPTIKR